MDYIKIKFGNDIKKPSSPFEKSIMGMFRSGSPAFSLGQGGWTPAMDIYETSDQIIVRAELAGVNKDDLGVEINSKAVRIHGNRSEPPRGEKATFRLAEIQYGRFERILFLPSPIDPEMVSTSYANGFLEIRLVKEQLEQAHRIEITQG